MFVSLFCVLFVCLFVFCFLFFCFWFFFNYLYMYILIFTQKNKSQRLPSVTWCWFAAGLRSPTVAISSGPHPPRTPRYTARQILFKYLKCYPKWSYPPAKWGEILLINITTQAYTQIAHTKYTHKHTMYLKHMHIHTCKARTHARVALRNRTSAISSGPHPTH